MLLCPALTALRYSADPLIVNGEALGTHCRVQPVNVGCFWYSAMAAVHCSRLSKVLGNTAMPPCGPAITRYQISAAVEVMAFPCSNPDAIAAGGRITLGQWPGMG